MAVTCCDGQIIIKDEVYKEKDNYKKRGNQTTLDRYNCGILKSYKEEEIIATLEKIAKEVDKDPKVAELAEEFQRRYGTLTEEDLKKTFTI